MRDFIIQLAEVENATEGDLLGTLGIDWTLLILQMVSFAILVLILAKFVYPPIVAMLDRNDKKIEEAVKATEEAQKNASEMEAKTAALLDQSRLEAAEIVAAAKKESEEIIIKAEEDAAIRAEAVMANARDDLDRDIERAREELRGEVVELVALATEKIINTKIGAEDKKLIQAVLEESGR